MTNNLNKLETVKKTGLEHFLFNGQALPFNVLTFWQWSNSELLGNALRGILAEYIVASSINCTDNLRQEWDAYDLITDNGIKIEVKSSSYLQSWQQNKLSTIGFGIQETFDIENDGEQIKKRQADVYVFCVLSHKDKKTVNPLDLNQWDFYVLSTKTLNQNVGHQKKISLSSLLNLNPTKVKYSQLNQAILNYK